MDLLRADSPGSEPGVLAQSVLNCAVELNYVNISHAVKMALSSQLVSGEEGGAQVGW